MAKIKLGNPPKSFKKNVKVQMLDGTDGEVGCLFKYRTRTDFGKFIDELTSEAGISIKSDAPFSLKELMEKTKDKNADYILKVVESWDLDVEFSRENVLQLCDEFPGAATAIMETYRIAINEGRLGN